MGLTSESTGINAANTRLVIKKKNEQDKVIAIAGNPNVGKSTLFNALTGMNQHTGNWPGKTIANAQGYCETPNGSYVMVDIPGTYSLFAHSPEEEVARNFICFGGAQAVIVVCDATCFERSLNLALQTLEITKNVIVCVNLLDEAKRKGIKINLEELSKTLGVPVVGTVARSKKSLVSLLSVLDSYQPESRETVYRVKYPDIIENAIKIIEPTLKGKFCGLDRRWLALRILERDKSFLEEIENYSDESINTPETEEALQRAEEYLRTEGVRSERLDAMIAAAVVASSESICKDIVEFSRKTYAQTDRKIDKILTGKHWGFIVMILLLCIIFWITISGANYISDFLSAVFSKLERLLSAFLEFVNTPLWLYSVIIDGAYKVTSWVVSVMLPPMAIFFPLFTLLEDAGYLPRVAYNLDNPFKRCKSCGKQALTMCMGFGCNAAGVVGCRIIDSPRERILATVTNSLVPCNGRFPAIITIISMFFITVSGVGATILSSFFLTTVILLGVVMTFVSTRILSATVLKGTPSSYTLEMPPYRKPQLGTVIVRSVFDRTLFVLGRSLSVAVPAGIIIWLMANITVSGNTLLAHCAEFLDPFARLLGLDGVILIAFILGFPANEIVIPIIIMAYLSTGTLTELSSVEAMRELFIANGWTAVTAVNVIIFTLFHWPCSTTLLTVKKETGSLKWTLLALIVPTAIGMIFCMAVNFTVRLF